MPCYYNYCFSFESLVNSFETADAVVRVATQPFESYDKYSNSIDTPLVSLATPFVVYAIFGLSSIFIKCDFHLKLWCMYVLYYLTFYPSLAVLTAIVYAFPLFFATYDVTTTKLEEYPVLAIYYFCVIYSSVFSVTFFNWCLGYDRLIGNFGTILYAPLFSIESIVSLMTKMIVG